jgi:hypothetical protein
VTPDDQDLLMELRDERELNDTRRFTIRPGFEITGDQEISKRHINESTRKLIESGPMDDKTSHKKKEK